MRETRAASSSRNKRIVLLFPEERPMKGKSVIILAFVVPLFNPPMSVFTCIASIE